MNRRIESRVVHYAVEGVGALINREATGVWWITISPHVLGAHGLVQIFDGFDAGGKLVWEAEPGYVRQYNFIPPIHCEQGVYVLTDDQIESYTIGYRAKKWDRPVTHPLDVIKPPAKEG